MDLQLQGKVALVTAASQGIGRAVGLRLAAEGAIVVMASRSGVCDTQGESFPGKVVPWQADLADAGATGSLVARVVAEFGRLDIAVLNTPGPAIKPFLDTTDADWAAAHEMLVRPMTQLALTASRQMVGQGSGNIVFLTSTWVKQPAEGGALSSSMRSAVSALSKQMALELAPKGVRVNQVQPGATATARMQNIVKMKAQKNGSSEGEEIGQIVKLIPMGRWGEPEEIADTVAFIVSPRAGFITGATLQIDGGATRTTI
ncbi:SDR family oxidoreductase [Paraburkholderia sp. HP33-1]|uniref:SDR family oxidoreductase n=1 Tax=Paraburkholderia sp. HP33-1 TaxID=2883243 RepID=UPI001F40B408|nr:SDR family oxidoreductase [Paraburkholderia sp. HP33-1]